MTRRGVILPFLLLLVVAVVAPPGLASNTWSDTDPVVVIVTPAGHDVSIYVNNGVLGSEHLLAAQVATMTYTVKPVSSGTATQVALTVTIPCDALSSTFQTRTLPSTGAFATGTVYGQVYGTCGQAIKVTFELPVS